MVLFLSCEFKKSDSSDLPKAKIVSIKSFGSEYVKERNIDIWLPDGYSNNQKYAVLYMHDGQMLYDSTTTWNKQEWGVDETMQKLIDEKKIRNTIVVGISNTELRHSEYFPQKPFESLPKTLQDSLINFEERNADNQLFKSKVISDNYLKFIVEELKPHIDNNYSTHQDKSNTYIAGSSMGGLISMYAICEYPAVFGGAACLSTHWPGTFDTLNNPIPNQFADYLENNLPTPADHKIYFDYGTETLDALYEPSQLNIDQVMKNKGYTSSNWITQKFDGADHSERSWMRRLDIPLVFLLGK